MTQPQGTSTSERYILKWIDFSREWMRQLCLYYMASWNIKISIAREPFLHYITPIWPHLAPKIKYMYTYTVHCTKKLHFVIWNRHCCRDPFVDDTTTKAPARVKGMLVILKWMDFSREWMRQLYLYYIPSRNIKISIAREPFLHYITPIWPHLAPKIKFMYTHTLYCTFTFMLF